MDENVVLSYRVYRIRWVQLFVFVLSTFANSICGMTFAPIESETSKFYGISTTEVNVLSIVFLFLYLIGTILFLWISKRCSMRLTIIIASLLNLGVFIRLLSLIKVKQGYAFLLIGQIFPAISAPFFINSTALFAARWFSISQRDIATSICSMANPLGLAIGSLVPSLIVNDNPTSKQFFILLISESLFVLFSTILVLILFRSSPLTPPSASEEHHQIIDLKQDFINLIQNFHYMTLLFGFSLGLALFNSLTTLLFQIIEPSYYTSEDAGIFGAIIILSGLFSAFIAGIIMDKTHAYRILLKILLIGATLSGIYFIIILRPNMFYPLSVSIGLMGFFLLPLLPVSFECAVECTYPIRAEWSTGLLMCTGNILGGLFIFLLEYLIKLDKHYKQGQILTPASIFILCGFVLSASALFTYRGPYKRLEAERQTVDQPRLNI